MLSKWLVRFRSLHLNNLHFLSHVIFQLSSMLKNCEEKWLKTLQALNGPSGAWSLGLTQHVPQWKSLRDSSTLLTLTGKVYLQRSCSITQWLVISIPIILQQLQSICGKNLPGNRWSICCSSVKPRFLLTEFCHFCQSN